MTIEESLDISVEDEDVMVFTLNSAGKIDCTTSTSRKYAQSMAKYYRSLGRKTRVLPYDEFINLLEKEKEEFYANMS